MHLGHFFKKIGHIGESMFGLARQPKSSGMPTTDGGTSPDAATPQLGGSAMSNAGDAVVNYQTKGKPGLQPTGQAPTGTA